MNLERADRAFIVDAPPEMAIAFVGDLEEDGEASILEHIDRYITHERVIAVPHGDVVVVELTPASVFGGLIRGRLKGPVNVMPRDPRQLTPFFQSD